MTWRVLLVMLSYLDQTFVLGYKKNKVLLLNPLPKQNMFQHQRLLLKLFGLGEYLKTLVKNKKKGIVLYCDNKSAIAIAKNPVSHERSKHIFDLFFIQFYSFLSRYMSITNTPKIFKMTYRRFNSTLSFYLCLVL